MGFRPIYKKVTVDGIKFDSEDESKYYLILKEKKEKGEISDLEIHPIFCLIPEYTDNLNKKHKSLSYEADFVYYDNIEEKYHVVDVKGFEEEHFKIKKKIFEYLYCFAKGNKIFDELEVLTYRKTLDGFVPLSEVKKLMKNKRQKLIEEKNYYKNIVIKQEREKKVADNKINRELKRLDELQELANAGVKLTPVQRTRLQELKTKYDK